MSTRSMVRLVLHHRCVTQSLPVLLITIVLGALSSCGSSSPIRSYGGHGFSFEVPRDLTLQQYTLDVRNDSSQKGPAYYDQGVLLSPDNNYMFRWEFAPYFTPELAAESVKQSATMFGSAGNPLFQANIGEVRRQVIAGHTVAWSEIDMVFGVAQTIPGIVGVVQCQPSQRVVTFMALHSKPEKELGPIS